jgi:ATP-binding cassette, subfamily B, multidrug efflux pump
VVKSYVKEKVYYKVFEEEANNYKSQAIKIEQIQAFFFPFFVGIISLSTIITVYYGGLLVLDKEVELKHIVEYVMYINMLTFPISAIGWVANYTQRGEASMQRINEFLSLKPAVENSGVITKSLEGDIIFNNVTLLYKDTNIQALKNVSFRVPAGEKWAIVGKTGSGKTTIAELLLRAYDPSEGQIKIDKTPLKEYEKGHYRSQIGYVPQDVFLFSDTIENNIGFGIKNIQKEAIIKAAQNAYIDKEINSFTEGYDTIIGERGVTLSGGQKQRISLARAFMIDPKILILDDCLSAVDVNTEHHIVTALNEVFRGKTSITITHRIFSAIQFDNILVLDKGEIIEQGTHESLMNTNGVYSELYHMQEVKETKE